jgi:hypothetical protein
MAAVDFEDAQKEKPQETEQGGNYYRHKHLGS